MRFQWNAFQTALNLQLRSWKTWLFVLLLPALVWSLLAVLPEEERSAPVQVGVSLPAEGGEAFWTLLEERSGVVVTFIRADEDTIAGKVASGQWDCGLLLPEDFRERLEALDTGRLITLCVGDGSTVYPLVRETVAACLAQLLSPGIAREYLLDSGIADEDTIRDTAPRLERTLPDVDRVGIAMTTLDGRALDAPALADSTLSNLLHGMISIVLLIWMLFSAMDMGRWLDTPAARRLCALRTPTELFLPRAAAAAVPLLCSAGAALCLLPAGGRDPWSLLAYLAALSGLSFLAARVRPVWTAFPVLTPIVPLFCLLTSPIILDPAGLFPAAALFRWTPVTLYLRACRGAGSAGVALWGWGAGALALSFALDRAKQSTIQQRDRSGN